MRAITDQAKALRARPARTSSIALALVFAFLAAGCGAVGHLPPQGPESSARGKELFKRPTLDGQPGCGSCHVMANAGTEGRIGPNLDDVFGIVRAQGFDESTIRDVVRGQIAYPETETVTGTPGMPADLVTGQDARDVAEYVATCAGEPDNIPNCEA